MSAGRAHPPQRVPTLTEVVEFGPPASPVAAPPVAAGAGDEELVARVLVEVQRQVDATLESRLREALAPLLARTAEALIRDTGAELASTLHAVVSRAVAQELARRRGPGRDEGTTPD